MFETYRRNKAAEHLLSNVEQATTAYFNSLPMWDEVVQRNAVRTCSTQVCEDMRRVRVGCTVRLHTGSPITTPSVYDAVWTEGLLNELIGVFQRQSLHVERIEVDGTLINLDITRP